MYEGYESTVSDLNLPVGDPENDYRLKVTITVLDAFQASSVVSKTVKVRYQM